MGGQDINQVQEEDIQEQANRRKLREQANSSTELTPHPTEENTEAGRSTMSPISGTSVVPEIGEDTSEEGSKSSSVVNNESSGGVSNRQFVRPDEPKEAEGGANIGHKKQASSDTKEEILSSKRVYLSVECEDGQVLRLRQATENVATHSEGDRPLPTVLPDLTPTGPTHDVHCDNCKVSCDPPIVFHVHKQYFILLRLPTHSPRTRNLLLASDGSVTYAMILIYAINAKIGQPTSMTCSRSNIQETTRTLKNL